MGKLWFDTHRTIFITISTVTPIVSFNPTFAFRYFVNVKIITKYIIPCQPDQPFHDLPIRIDRWSAQQLENGNDNKNNDANRNVITSPKYLYLISNRKIINDEGGGTSFGCIKPPIYKNIICILQSRSHWSPFNHPRSKVFCNSNSYRNPQQNRYSPSDEMILYFFVMVECQRTMLTNSEGAYRPWWTSSPPTAQLKGSVLRRFFACFSKK